MLGCCLGIFGLVFSTLVYTFCCFGVVFFLLNLWDGPVHLDRCSEVGHCTGGTSSLQVFFVVLIFGLLSHLVGLVDRHHLEVSTFSGLVDRY